MASDLTALADEFLEITRQNVISIHTSIGTVALVHEFALWLEARGVRVASPAAPPAPAVTPELEHAIRTVFDGFDHGVFVRDTSGDGQVGWSVRILPYITALGELRAALGAAPSKEPE